MHNRPKKISRFFLLLSAMLLVVSACSDDDTDQIETIDTASSEPENVSPNGETVGPNLDLELFRDSALVGDPTEVDCELSDGSASTCYEITIAGIPSDHETGPFCPTTSEAVAEEVGIWIEEGDAIYDLDGEFIKGLAEFYEDDAWKLYDDEGNVYVTDSAEKFNNAAVVPPSDEFANHCVEGLLEYLDGGEPVTSTFLVPTVPVSVNETSESGRNPWGMTLNGIRIDPRAPIEIITGAYTIAAFDDCGGHYNPFEGYHMHAAMDCSTVDDSSHGTVFGYSLDGYKIYSNDQSISDLDACGGHEFEEVGYHYHASPPEDNSVLKCWSGAVAEQYAGDAGGPPNGQGPPRG